MGYTKWQLKYIHATDGVAHNSAVEIIGILDARVTELEAQLAKANDNLYYALELAIAHAPAKADVEWAAGLIERMDQPAPTKEEERDGEI